MSQNCGQYNNECTSDALEHKLLLCMQELENVELNEINVNRFFDNVGSILGIKYKTKNQNKNEKNNKNKKKDIKEKIHKKSYNIKSKSNDNSAKEVAWTYEDLFIYYQNVRSLRKKNHIIKPKTFETEYDIIALTETCFDSSNNNDEYFVINFQYFAVIVL